MGRQIHVDLERTIPAPPARVHAVLADYRMEVAEPTPGVTLVERDRDSSLVTTWILSPTASGTATDLRLSTIWEGGGGVGGFFERTFAPRGLRRIHGELLDRLARQPGAGPVDGP